MIGVKRLRRALTALLLSLSLIYMPARTLAAEPPLRRLGVSVTERHLLVTFSYRDAFTRPISKKLRSGLTTTVLVQLTLESQRNAAPITYWARNVEITYDLWEDEFIITREDAAGKRRTTVKSRAHALELAGTLIKEPVANLRGIPAGNYRIRARIETNPVSKEMVDKIRHWLVHSRAAKSGAPAPSNYFGSFVGALVDRRIGQADHQIDFISQWFYLGER